METGIRYRQRLYTPLVTQWAMVYQVMCLDLGSTLPRFYFDLIRIELEDKTLLKKLDGY